MFDITGVLIKIISLICVISFVLGVVYKEFVIKPKVIGSIEIYANHIIRNNDELFSQIIYNKDDIYKIKIEYDGFKGEDYSFFKWINIKSGVKNNFIINYKGDTFTYKILIESMEKMKYLDAFLKSNNFIYEIKNMNNLKLLFDKNSP